LFLSVASFGLMTDDAHNMSLLALLIQGVAHGLAVDGQTLIPCAIAFVPALQGAIQIGGRDADSTWPKLSSSSGTSRRKRLEKALWTLPTASPVGPPNKRSEEHTSELQSPCN